jgi:murein DD-endopeptidase MepM/ murein hydrolase activator NlpD
MEGTIELNFGRPVGDDITKPGGKFGATRHYGPHKGVDFRSNWGTGVKAIEWGEVVCSLMREGSKEKANYGNVIAL